MLLGIPPENSDPRSERGRVEWNDFSLGGVYSCAIRLIREGDRLISVYVPSLPGTASQGETEEEALGNIKEALVGAIQVHKESGTSIPWSAVTEPTEPSEVERWITVHV
jgi:predicted RNase H-like HicB family nuclease